MLDDSDKQWIREELERIETKLLTEFHKWASPVETRERSSRARLNALDMEIDSLKDRVADLESREDAG